MPPATIHAAPGDAKNLTKPQLRGEPYALQLAGRTFRNLIEEHYLPRHFEIREALANEAA